MEHSLSGECSARGGALPPILISLRPSRRLLQLLAVAHGLSATAILTLSVSPWLRGALLLLTLASAVYQYGRQRNMPFVALRLFANGGCEIATTVGAGETATILPETCRFPGLTVLALRVLGQRHTLVLLPDSATAEDLRRLHVWLCCRAGRVSASA